MKWIRMSVILACLLVGLPPVSLGQKCQSKGWFGENCKYKCHCQKDVECDSNGDCVGSCAGGWFGPRCQYIDEAYTNPSARNRTTTDGKDSTCYEIRSEILLDLTSHVQFTWMRLVFRDTGMLDSLTFYFKAHNGSRINPLSPLKQVKVSDRILDFHGKFDKRISSIGVKKTGTESFLCSMFVSGGRNVALKQVSSQSSTFDNDEISYGSENAVDGFIDIYGTEVPAPICTKTMPAKFNYWTLRITAPVYVNKYVLYIEKDSAYSICIVTYFQIKTSNGPVNTQNKQSSVAEGGIFRRAVVYEFDNSHAVTSVNISVNQDSWSQNDDVCSSDSHNTLALCEVEIFGEYALCELGRWGPLCENFCDCLNSACDETTGACSGSGSGSGSGTGSGSASGSESGSGSTSSSTSGSPSGSDSESGSSPGSGSGSGSESGSGSDSGSSSASAPIDGSGSGSGSGSTSVPIDGSGSSSASAPGDGSGSSSASAPGDGSGSGSTSPPGDGSDSGSGSVFDSGCEPGSQAAGCDQVCANNTWGDGCSKRCSEHCAGGGWCDVIDGHCAQGCEPGYQGDMCDRTCEHLSYGDGCKSICSPNCLTSHSAPPNTSSTCHHVSGHCLFGCQRSFSGPFCTIFNKTDTGNTRVRTKSRAAVIGLSVFGAVLAALVVVGFILTGLYTKKNDNPSHHQRTHRSSHKKHRSPNRMDKNKHILKKLKKGRYKHKHTKNKTEVTFA